MKYFGQLVLAATIVVLLFACSSNKKANSNSKSSMSKTEQTSNNSDSGKSVRLQQIMLEKWNDGIDFYAFGNEPFWSLEMDMEKDFHFKTLDGDEIIVPAVEGVGAMDADVMRFRSKSESGELIIQISHLECLDNMSGEKFHFKVTVDYKTAEENDYTTYNGCGSYVPDPRLHDIWAIVKLGEETISPDDFLKGGPMVELNIAKEEVIGSDGCNRFRGRFEIMGNHIVFGNLAGTRMACPNMEISDRISQAISGENLIYKLKSGNLLFLKEGKIVMTLKHID